LRNLVLRFDGSPAFARALHERDQELALPGGLTVDDGEWVLAIFEVGEKRRATASAARGLWRGPDDTPVLVFDRRDWERLVDFAEAGSVGMMRAAPAVSSSPPRQPGIAIRARILVVDDEREVRDLVATVLEAVGLTVDVVGTAEEALERVRRDGCDLLVLDWTLPGMTGLELCKLLRRDATLAALPILFLAAQASSQNVVDAFAAGADDFVTRPFRAPELGARIFGLLRRARLSIPDT
jgi:two-component system phosphate regulon response regulator PhoB